MISNKKKFLTIAMIAGLLVIIVITKNLFHQVEKQETLTFNEVTQSSEPQEAQKEPETIKVHITGEVNTPGLIELEVGSRIADAIDLAGGLTSEADTSKTNLAYILSDGEKIYIPNINDEETTSQESATLTTNKININTATQQDLTTIPRSRRLNCYRHHRIQNQKRKIYNNRRRPKRLWNRSK